MTAPAGLNSTEGIAAKSVEATKPEPVWWSYISLACRTAIQIACSAALARLLSPTDFGIAAMLSTLLAILTMLSEMGLNWVMIQKATIDVDEVDALFCFSLMLGSATALLCVLLGPALSWFFHNPALRQAAILAALTFPFSAIAVQPMALLRRALLLKEIFRIEAAAVLISSAAAVAVAVWLKDYRALIAQAIVLNAARAILSLWRSGYRPRWPEHLRANISFLGAGGWLQAFQVFTQLFRNFDNVIVGSYCGARELGFYARAYYLTTIPSQFTVGTLNESVIPKLSVLWNNAGDFGGEYRMHLKVAAAFSMPLAVFLACCSPEIIYVLYGPKWSGVDYLLAIMALTAALQPLYNSSYWLLMAAGKFRFMTALGAINCGVLIAGFMVGVRGGAVGVAEAYGSLMVLLTVSTMVAAHTAVGAPLVDTLRVLKLPLAASIVLGAELLLIRVFATPFHLPPPILLLLMGVTGAATLLGCGLASLLRNVMGEGRHLSQITADDLISEIRRLFGDERHQHRSAAG